jgi:hypothetical protein
MDPTISWSSWVQAAAQARGANEQGNGVIEFPAPHGSQAVYPSLGSGVRRARGSPPTWARDPEPRRVALSPVSTATIRSISARLDACLVPTVAPPAKRIGGEDVFGLAPLGLE